MKALIRFASNNKIEKKREQEESRCHSNYSMVDGPCEWQQSYGAGYGIAISITLRMSWKQNFLVQPPCEVVSLLPGCAGDSHEDTAKKLFRESIPPDCFLVRIACTNLHPYFMYVNYPK